MASVSLAGRRCATTPPPMKAAVVWTNEETITTQQHNTQTLQQQQQQPDHDWPFDCCRSPCSSGGLLLSSVSLPPSLANSTDPSDIHILQMLCLIGHSPAPITGRHFPDPHGDARFVLFTDSAQLAENARAIIAIKEKEGQRVNIQVQSLSSPSSLSLSSLLSLPFDVFLFDFRVRVSLVPPIARAIDADKHKYFTTFISAKTTTQHILLDPLSPMIRHSIGRCSCSSCSSSSPAFYAFRFLAYSEHGHNDVRIDDRTPLTHSGSSPPDAVAVCHAAPSSSSVGCSALMPLARYLAQIAYKIGKTGKYGA